MRITGSCGCKFQDLQQNPEICVNVKIPSIHTLQWNSIVHNTLEHASYIAY